MSVHRKRSRLFGTLRAGTPRPRPLPASADRDPFFDNAKLLTLVLVVCGHFWEPFAQQPGQHRVLHAAYLLVFTFHMPVFVFISGYFSRSFTAKPHQLRRLLTGVLVPYLVWSTLLALFSDWLQRTRTTPDPLLPTWITWFLLSLFLWRVTAPFWKLLKAPVTIAALISLLAGAISVGSELSIGRTLEFLPFFVAGLTLRPALIDRLKNARLLRVAAVPALAAAALGCYWIAPRTQLEWFYRSANAAALGGGFPHWAVVSLGINLGGLVLGALFLTLVPRRRSWITPLGAASMYGFLIHAFIQRALIHEGVYTWAFTRGAAGALALTALAALLAIALCTSPPAKILRPLVEPRLNWLFQRGERKSPPSPDGAARLVPEPLSWQR